MANIIKRTLLALALLSLSVPAVAQVSLPRTGVMNNAQPVFCVNPTTAAIEDCVSGGGGGGGAITAASGSYASGALSAGAIVDLGTGSSPGANTTNGILKTINITLGTPFQAGGSIGNTSFAVTNAGTFAVQCALCALETGGNLATLVTNTSSLMKSTGGTVGLVAGSAIVGKVGIDQTTPGTTNGVQVNAALPAGANTIGAVTQASGPWTVTDGASATGGATPVSVLSANSTNATNVKASAGTLYHISVQNNSTSGLAYVIFFNSAGTPTCTGTPYYGPILIPYVGSTGNNGSGVIEDIAVGLNFSTGIAYCLTTAPGGTGSVAANQVSGGLGYK